MLGNVVFNEVIWALIFLLLGMKFGEWIVNRFMLDTFFIRIGLDPYTQKVCDINFCYPREESMLYGSVDTIENASDWVSREFERSKFRISLAVYRDGGNHQASFSLEYKDLKGGTSKKILSTFIEECVKHYRTNYTSLGIMN